MEHAQQQGRGDWDCPLFSGNAFAPFSPPPFSVQARDPEYALGQTRALPSVLTDHEIQPRQPRGSPLRDACFVWVELVNCMAAFEAYLRSGLMHAFLVSWPRPRHQVLERRGLSCHSHGSVLAPGLQEAAADVGRGAHETVGSSLGEDSGFNSVAFAHEMFPPSAFYPERSSSGW